MMGAGALEPRLTCPVNSGGLVIDLTPYQAGENIDIDERRLGVAMWDGADTRRIVDYSTDQAFSRQVRNRHVRNLRYGLAAICIASATDFGRCPLPGPCDARRAPPSADSAPTLVPTISTAIATSRIAFMVDSLRLAMRPL